MLGTKWLTMLELFPDPNIGHYLLVDEETETQGGKTLV